MARVLQMKKMFGPFGAPTSYRPHSAATRRKIGEGVKKTAMERVIDSTPAKLTEEFCACGLYLHYSAPAIRLAVEEIIKLRGTHLRVTTPGGTFLVQRHYIALHGLRAEELPTLGFERVSE